MMAAPRFVVILCVFTSLAANAQKLVWSDEFRDSGGVPNPDVWSIDTGGGGWRNGEIQTYSENNVKVEGGKLVITVESEDSTWGGRTFTSGRIRSNEKFEFQYGTVETKIKVPDVANGLWPALWMLGTTFPEVDWPMSGEIDIMELGSARALQLGNAKTRVGSGIHWEAFGKTQQTYNELDTPFDMTDDFHIYKLEWTPDSITTYVDDIPIVQKNISADYCSECEELHQAYFFVINMAVGGGYTRIYHEGGVTAGLPAELLVDYIRVFDNGFTQLSGASMETTPPSVSPPSAPPSDGTIRDEKPALTEPATAEKPISTPTALTISPPPTALPTQSIQAPTTPPVSSTVSTLPKQRLEASGVRMVISNIEPLNPVAAQKWTDVTSQFLATQVKLAIGLVESVNVEVFLVTQNPPFVFRRAWRLLQQDGQQEIVFDAIFDIRSVVEINDVNRFIVGSLNTFEKKISYISTLQALDVAFENADDVVVSPAASVLRVVQNRNDTDDLDRGLGIGLVIGIVLASLALVILFVAIVYARRRKSSGKKTRQGSKTSNSEECESPTAKAYRGDDDSMYKFPSDTPSTCEESLYTSPSKGTLDYQFTCPRSSKMPATVVTSDSEFAEYIASFRKKPQSQPTPVCDDSESEFTGGSQTYDYAAAYKNMHGSIADSQSQMTDQVTNDDQTVVAEFEVKVPPGNLGIILQSSEDGAPVVQTVKKSSPLFGRVYQGDRLISLDGRDVTMVMATTVTRIIASKRDNPTRRFVFARPMEI